MEEEVISCPSFGSTNAEMGVMWRLLRRDLTAFVMVA